MSVNEKILEILKSVKPTKDLAGVDNIIESGYLDSFELMALINELSEKFEIEIGFEDIIPENFNSVDAMAEMVNRIKES